MATKDDATGERTYGLFGRKLDELMSEKDHDVYMGSLGREVGAHLREALAELALLRQQLDGLAEHFDQQAKGAYGSSFADGVAHANKAAAAHVRGIVNAGAGKGGAGGQG